MACFFFPPQEQHFTDHPVYEGVQVARLVGRDAGMPVGVLLLKLEPGVEIPVHTHEDNLDSIYVAAGRAALFTDGAWQEAGPGTCLLAPAGEEHGVRNAGREPLLLLVHHSPALM